MRRHVRLHMITLDKLVIGYRGRGLFSPFSLTVPRGTMNVIVGANGTGKSTLLHTIAGLLPPVAGEIFIDGENLKQMGRRSQARTMSFVYTERNAATGLTVREVVETGRYPHTGFLGRMSAEDKVVVEAAMHDVGIEHKADAYLSDISDGERQKTMIARVLAQQTPVVLLDEPTNFLDAASRIETLGLIKRLTAEKGITALISTHDIPTALSLADNVITVLPSDAAPVEITPVGSDRAIHRLDSVFVDRGIRFDPMRRDYILNQLK